MILNWFWLKDPVQSYHMPYFLVSIRFVLCKRIWKAPCMKSRFGVIISTGSSNRPTERKKPWKLIQDCPPHSNQFPLTLKTTLRSFSWMTKNLSKYNKSAIVHPWNFVQEGEIMHNSLTSNEHFLFIFKVYDVKQCWKGWFSWSPTRVTKIHRILLNEPLSFFSRSRTHKTHITAGTQKILLA